MKTKKLAGIRTEFNAIDKKIIGLLQKRAKLSKKVGKLKNELNLPILQKEVWAEQRKKRQELNKKENIRAAFLEKVFDLIHKESIRIQKQRSKKTR